MTDQKQGMRIGAMAIICIFTLRATGQMAPTPAVPAGQMEPTSIAQLLPAVPTPSIKSVVESVKAALLQEENERIALREKETNVVVDRMITDWYKAVEIRTRQVRLELAEYPHHPHSGSKPSETEKPRNPSEKAKRDSEIKGKRAVDAKFSLPFPTIDAADYSSDQWGHMFPQDNSDEAFRGFNPGARKQPQHIHKVYVKMPINSVEWVDLILVGFEYTLKKQGFKFDGQRVVSWS